MNIWDFITVFGSGFGFGFAFPYILHYRQKWKDRKKEFIQRVYSPVEKEITRIIEEAKKYESIGRDLLRGLENIKIDAPHKLIRKLKEIKEKLDEYNDWHYECKEMIRNKLILDDRAKTEELRQQWKSLGKKDFGHNIAEIVSPLIYEGKLKPDSVKEKILSRYGRSLKIQQASAITGKTREITLRGMVESEEFYNLVKKLKKLENLLSIKMFRKTKKELCDKCKELRAWIQKKISYKIFNKF